MIIRNVFKPEVIGFYKCPFCNATHATSFIPSSSPVIFPPTIFSKCGMCLRAETLTYHMHVCLNTQKQKDLFMTSMLYATCVTFKLSLD